MDEEKKNVVAEEENKKVVQEKKKKDEKVEPKKEEKVEKNKEKKQEDKKENKEESKKSKKGVVALVIVLIIIALAVVGYFAALKYQEASANKYVAGMFESLRTGDYSEKEQYMQYDEIFGSENSEDEAQSLEEINMFFEKLDYKILDTKADFKNATVDVEVYNKDMGTVITNYFGKAFELAFAAAFSEDYTEEKVNEELKTYLQEQVNSDEIETVTKNVSIKLEIKDGKWNITNNEEEFTRAILPGFMEKIEAIGNSYNQLEDAE